jgi:hypothetical protein
VRILAAASVVVALLIAASVHEPTITRDVINSVISAPYQWWDYFAPGRGERYFDDLVAAGRIALK